MQSPPFHLPVSCPQCNKEMRSAKVKTTIWHKERLIVVEEIPAYVCDTCVEQFYDAEATEMLRKLTAGEFASLEATHEILVPVYSLAGLVSDTPRISYEEQEIY